MPFTHDTFISPLTWRYGTEKMRALFSETHKRILLRKVWIALAEVQQTAGLVTEKQVAELKEHALDIDIETATKWENMIHHDLMAEIKTYAAQCPTAGAIIHLGATSMDIEDNAEAIRLKEALSLTIEKTAELLEAFISKMETYKDVPCMAFTHIQPAEPTTIGYRFAQTAQDLTDDLNQLKATMDSIKGKGIKGAVGTAASYGELVKDRGMSAMQLEKAIMDKLGIKPFTAATQIYTRKQDLRVSQALGNVAATIAKFALDFRLMMTPPIGEWSEPFGKKQVGSSAMPFKRNPINCEKIDSLSRYVNSMTQVLWHDCTDEMLERTLDDSANRRLVLPGMFITLDEMIKTCLKVVNGMVIHTETVNRNMETYGLFAASEKLLMELGKAGADRQQMHEVIRNNSLVAWEAVQKGKKNPLADLLSSDKEILSFIDKERVLALLDASAYTGDAKIRTEMVIEESQLAIRMISR